MVLKYDYFYFDDTNGGLKKVQSTTSEYLYLPIVEQLPTYDEVIEYQQDALTIYNIEKGLSSSNTLKTFLYAIKYTNGTFGIGFNFAHVIQELILSGELSNQLALPTFPAPQTSNIANLLSNYINSVPKPATRKYPECVLPIVTTSIKTLPLSTDLSTIFYSIIFKTANDYKVIDLSLISGLTGNIYSGSSDAKTAIASFSQATPFLAPLFTSSIGNLSDYKNLFTLGSLGFQATPQREVQGSSSSQCIVGYNANNNTIAISGRAYNIPGPSQGAGPISDVFGMSTSTKHGAPSTQSTLRSNDANMSRLRYTESSMQDDKVFLFMQKSNNNPIIYPSFSFKLSGANYVYYVSQQSSVLKTSWPDTIGIYETFDTVKRTASSPKCSNLWGIKQYDVPIGVYKDLASIDFTKSTVVYPKSEVIAISSYPMMEGVGAIDVDTNGFPTNKYKYSTQILKTDISFYKDSFHISLRDLISSGFLKVNSTMSALECHIYNSKTGAITPAQYGLIINYALGSVIQYKMTPAWSIRNGPYVSAISTLTRFDSNDTAIGVVNSITEPFYNIKLEDTNIQYVTLKPEEDIRIALTYGSTFTLYEE